MKGFDVDNYGQKMVYGSLAYDFSNTSLAEEIPFEPEYEPEYEQEYYPEYEQQYEPDYETEREAFDAAQEQEQTAAETAPRHTQAIAPVSILGFACAAVLMVFMLISYIHLIEVSEASVALESQLSELELERTRLLIDYESAFNLTSIEEYATGVLGMQKPRSDQVFYIDGSSPDKAEIISSGEKKNSILAVFDELLTSVKEYFG